MYELVKKEYTQVVRRRNQGDSSRPGRQDQSSVDQVRKGVGRCLRGFNGQESLNGIADLAEGQGESLVYCLICNKFQHYEKWLSSFRHKILIHLSLINHYRFDDTPYSRSYASHSTREIIRFLSEVVARSHPAVVTALCACMEAIN